MTRWLLAATYALTLFSLASSALMAIDLGSEYFKISTVPAGKAPVGVVVNEMSRRKSPALVGFFGGERLVGEEAFSFAVRSPETVYHRTRDLLGKMPDDDTIVSMLKDHGLPYNISSHPSRGVASLQPGPDDPLYSSEELVASILQYARSIAESAAGGTVVDAVITVPAFFGQAQRRALYDAGRLAGLNVLGLINQHTAAALQYGIERDFINKTQHIILYDQGSGSTQVALVRYSHYVIKEAGKPKEYSQLEVRDVDWDASLGSNNLDMLLADLVAKQFMEKYKITTDIRLNARAMAKLRRQVRRTKEVLSANTMALVSVEELYDGHDYQGTITREEFEVMAGDYWKRSGEPLRRILERNALKPEDIEAVELLGGGSRIPRLQTVLSDLLGGRQLDRHLDADEAVVLGAGLFAANLSSSYRLRKFGMSDMSMFGIQLSVDEMHKTPPAAAAAAGGTETPATAAASKVAASVAAPTAGDAEGASAGNEAGTPAAQPSKLHNLLPFMKKVPVKRILHFTNVSRDPIRFTLAYNTSTSSGLPPGVNAPELGHFHVTGVETAIRRYNTSGQINLRFEADYGGLLSLENVEAVIEYEVMEEKIIEVKDEGGVNSTATDSKAGGANATASTEEGVDGKGGPGGNKAGKVGEEKEGVDDADKDAEKDSDQDIDEDAAADPADAEAAAAKPDSKAGDKEAPDGAEGKAGEEVDASDKGNATSSGGGGGGASGNTTTAGADGKNATTSVKRIMVPRKKLAKVSLNVSGPGWKHPALVGDNFSASLAIMTNWQRAEDTKKDNARAKNDLESYIIKSRDVLESDDVMQQVTTSEQREVFLTALTTQEEWLYDDGEHENAMEFRKRLRTLQDIGNPIVRRASEFGARDKIVEELKRVQELRLKVIKAWPESKPWIHENETAVLMEKVDAFQSWFEQKLLDQEKLAPHEEPAYSTDELKDKYEALEKAFNRLNNKRKPKPPPEPTPMANGTTNGTTNSTSDDAQGADDGEGAAGKEGSGNQTGDNSAKSDAGGSKKSDNGDSKKKPEASDKKKPDASDKKKPDASDKKKPDASDKKKAEADKKKADAKRKADDKKKAEDKKKADKRKADDKKKAEDKRRQKGSSGSSGDKTAPPNKDKVFHDVDQDSVNDLLGKLNKGRGKDGRGGFKVYTPDMMQDLMKDMDGKDGRPNLNAKDKGEGKPKRTGSGTDEL